MHSRRLHKVNKRFKDSCYRYVRIPENAWLRRLYMESSCIVKLKFKRNDVIIRKVHLKRANFKLKKLPMIKGPWPDDYIPLPFRIHDYIGDHFKLAFKYKD